jgi:hypothetical protein
MFSGIAWFRRRAGWARDGLTVAVGAVAVLGALAGAPLSAAAGEPAPPGGSNALGGSSAPGGFSATVCPSPNPPNPLAGRPARVTAGVGAIQSTPMGAGFPIRLAVTVTDAQRSPVPGAPVTFTAPARGPSGRFTTRTPTKHSRPRVSRHRSVTIVTDACGIAVAPAFVANDEQGGYIVKANVEHVRPAAFALVNTGAGQHS